MTGLAVLLLVAAAGQGIASRFRAPAIPLFLLGGIAVSPLAGGGHDAALRHALELGLAFLVFATGIELNPQRFARQRKAVVLVSLGQFLAVGLIGYLLALLLGFGASKSLYVAAALSASSTLVVVRILVRGRRIAEPFGRLVVGVLLLQDILIILLILVISGAGEGAGSLLKNCAGALLLGLLSLGVHRWSAVRFLLRRNCSNEVLLLAVLGHLFLGILLARLLDLHMVFGAFAAGFSLSSFPANNAARTLLSSLTDFFLAVFFAALGVFVGIPEDPLVLARGLALGLCLILVTPPVVAFIAQRQGLTSRNAIEAGILLAQSSEYALILGIIGSSTLEILSHQDLQSIAWMAAFTMTLTPLLANDGLVRRLLRLHPDSRRGARALPDRGPRPDPGIRHRGHVGGAAPDRGRPPGAGGRRRSSDHRPPQPGRHPLPEGRRIEPAGPAGGGSRPRPAESSPRCAAPATPSPS